MKINEVVKKLNISHDTLRFYEKSGLLGVIKRDDSGFRNYNDSDLKRIAVPFRNGNFYLFIFRNSKHIIGRNVQHFTKQHKIR